MKEFKYLLCGILVFLYLMGCSWRTKPTSQLKTQGNTDATQKAKLIEVSIANDENSVQELLRAGADPNVRASNGDTALLCAVVWGNAKCVKTLIANGADPLLADKNGLNAIDYAKIYPDLAGLLPDKPQTNAPQNLGVKPTVKTEKPSTNSNDEVIAWKKLNALDVRSLVQYIAQFPKGQHKLDAIKFLVMQKRMGNVRSGFTQASGQILTNAILGNAWVKDQHPKICAGGIYVSSDVSMAGVYCPVGGGATPKETIVGNTALGMGDGMEGVLTLPILQLGEDWKQLAKQKKPLNLEIWPWTGDGSIIGFDTNGSRIGVYGWVVEAQEGSPLVFGVVRSVGLVHLAGSGIVTLNNDKVVTFK